MTLEAHQTIARRSSLQTDIDNLISSNGITTANFQAISIAWNATGEEIAVVILADTGV